MYLRHLLQKQDFRDHRNVVFFKNIILHNKITHTLDFHCSTCIKISVISFTDQFHWQLPIPLIFPPATYMMVYATTSHLILSFFRP